MREARAARAGAASDEIDLTLKRSLQHLLNQLKATRQQEADAELLCDEARNAEDHMSQQLQYVRTGGHGTGPAGAGGATGATGGATGATGATGAAAAAATGPVAL